MKFCNNCGAQLPEGVRFCPNCGAPNAPQQQFQPQGQPQTQQYQNPPAAPGNIPPQQFGQVPAMPPMPSAPYGNAPQQPAPVKSNRNRSTIIAVIAAVVAVLVVVGLVVFSRPSSPSGGSSSGGLGKPGAPAGTWSFSVKTPGATITAITIDVDKDGGATLSMLGKKYAKADLRVSDYDKESVTYDVDDMKALVSNDDGDDSFRSITMPRTGVVGNWTVNMKIDDENWKYGMDVKSNHDVSFNWDNRYSSDSIDATWKKGESGGDGNTYEIDDSWRLARPFLDGTDNDADSVKMVFTVPSNR
ncbi:zinc ribbon domain-containing protein [Bifidobacterium sp. ESL0775]|uniref:zinc ribbon domain-containing protein n=1 Tax=Bifidobacterium sp. ESL0775 TaxID=2983230 RepID=UPI0023F734BB|nr:zinc ribbon domain-containing protein [Bifidobacterium sp. ESL0775]WEV70009.1 zinc ribbon domain-containing protein [Bifidobacterium sp. ESL0775]